MNTVTNWMSIESQICDMTIEQEYTATYDDNSPKHERTGLEYHDHVRIQIGGNYGNRLYMNKESASKLWKAIRRASFMTKFRPGCAILKYSGCVWDFWKQVMATADELGIEYKVCC